MFDPWVLEELKQRGQTDYLEGTDWVPVCDGDLTDNVVDNRVWTGGRFSELLYCSVGGDISQRKEGRLLIHVGRWLPGGGCEANISLADEPSSRAVGAVQILVGGEWKPMTTEDPLPSAAVIFMPPPLGSVTSHGDAESSQTVLIRRVIYR
jgi:hypothetical protein